jgi:hypothetical protein
MRERARKLRMNGFYRLGILHRVVSRSGIANMPYGNVSRRNVPQKISEYVVHKPNVFMANKRVVGVKRGNAGALLSSVLQSEQSGRSQARSLYRLGTYYSEYSAFFVNLSHNRYC